MPPIRAALAFAPDPNADEMLRVLDSTHPDDRATAEGLRRSASTMLRLELYRHARDQHRGSDVDQRAEPA